MDFWFFGCLDVWFFGFWEVCLQTTKGASKKTKIQRSKVPKIQKTNNPKKTKIQSLEIHTLGLIPIGQPKFQSLVFWIFGPPKLWIFGILAASRNFQAQGRKFKIAGIHSEAIAKGGTIWPSTEACTLTDIATLGLGRPGGPAKPQGCKVCRSPGLSAWTFCPSCGCGF